MAVPRSAKNLTTAQITKQLSDGLAQAARGVNIYGYQPHVKQVAFHSMLKPTRLYIGGNRSGKTVGGIVEDLWWLLGRHPYLQTPPPPVRGRIVSVDFLYGVEQIIIPEITRWVPKSELRGGSWYSAYDSQERILHFENGSTVEFKSYEQDLEKFAGTSRHFIHFDEEPPKHIYNECMMRLIDTGGWSWITMTPVEGMTWISEDIYEPSNDGRREDIGVVEVEMTENPHISPVEMERVLQGLDEDERDARKSGKIVQMGGLVYKRYDPQIHIVDRFTPPKTWLQYGGYDHGFNNPAAYLYGCIAPSEGNYSDFPPKSLVIWDEYYERERTVDQIAGELKHRNGQPNRRAPDIQIADPSINQRNAVTGTSIRHEFAIRGFPFALGNNDVRTGVDKTTQYLYNDPETPAHLYICENNVKLLREIKKLRWKTYNSRKLNYENNAREEIHKKDDHACDALRYLCAFLPDLEIPMEKVLSPFDHAKKTVEGQIKPVRGAKVAGTIDEILANLRPQEPNTEWTVVDEHMGGIW
jgi:phage terminase large subunit-like protein